MGIVLSPYCYCNTAKPNLNFYQIQQTEIFMKLLTFITFATLFICLLSCKHTTEYFEIDDSPEEIDFSNFHFKYFDFDSVHIVSNEDFYLDKMSVNEIIVYEQLNDTVTLYCKVLPTYTKVDEKYRIDFEIPIKGSAPVVNYNIYFNLLDEEYVQVDTTISFLAPPTADAMFHFELKDIPDWRPKNDDYFDNMWWYQDIDAFDISENSNYWVFRVRDYYFGWDRNDDTAQYLDVYKELPTNNKILINNPLSPWGVDVVFYNNMLYFDYMGDIRKMDYNNGTYTYFFDYDKYPNLEENSIIGLADDSQHLYVSTNACWIIILDHSGAYINKIKVEPCLSNYYWRRNIEVYNNILYIYLDETREFLRYALKEGVFLSPVSVPANYQYCGFRIKFDRVYYIDWEYGAEKMVSVPLSNILNE